MKERPQNERRKRFISEYLETLNASEEARNG
jgi:phage terminase small subunit